MSKEVSRTNLHASSKSLNGWEKGRQGKPKASETWYLEGSRAREVSRQSRMLRTGAPPSPLNSLFTDQHDQSIPPRNFTEELQCNGLALSL